MFKENAHFCMFDFKIVGFLQKCIHLYYEAHVLQPKIIKKGAERRPLEAAYE